MTGLLSQTGLQRDREHVASQVRDDMMAGTGHLLQDHIEADGAHFLGTIITLNTTTDAVHSGVLELID
jgi:hypothetical protein